MRDFYSFRVKKPIDSRAEWDLYEKIATVPALEAATPPEESSCPLIKR